MSFGITSENQAGMPNSGMPGVHWTLKINSTALLDAEKLVLSSWLISTLLFSTRLSHTATLGLSSESESDL